ncbi:DUF721 domain-containing protein [Thermaurantiacus sp.]
MRKRANEESPPQRQGQPRPVGDLLGGAGARAFRRFGFAQGQLVARWRDIVGPSLARWSVPESLRPARGRGASEGATLVVRVEGPFALQLQHAEPVIRERCNRILGYMAVGRIRLVQGPVCVASDRSDRREEAPPALEPGPSLRSIADPGLRSALEDLARAVACSRGPPRIG